MKPDAETQQAIHDALAWQKNTDQWKRNIIPLAGSYLRGARWEDEATSPPKPTLPTVPASELWRFR